MNLKPLGDRIVAEVLEEEQTTASGIVLPDTAQEKPQRRVTSLEVLCAVLAAWLLLDERITSIQAVGGLVVLLGLVLARPGDSTGEQAPKSPPEADERIMVPPPDRDLEQLRS